jgi:transposase InsO family protein
MESCFGSLKTELELKPYRNWRVAQKEVTDYIRYYNTRRRHSGIGYMSPAAFEDCPR